MPTQIKGTPTNSANEAVVLDASGRLPAVDGSQLTGIATLPAQAGNSGKFLTTNGSVASWGALTNPIKHWCVFNGSTGAITAQSGGISVTRNAVGDYTVTLGSAMASANYAVIGNCTTMDAGNSYCGVSLKYNTTQTPTGFTLWTANPSVGPKDPTVVMFSVIGV